MSPMSAPAPSDISSALAAACSSSLSESWYASSTRRASPSTRALNPKLISSSASSYSWRSRSRCWSSSAWTSSWAMVVRTYGVSAAPRTTSSSVSGS